MGSIGCDKVVMIPMHNTVTIPRYRRHRHIVVPRIVRISYKYRPMADTNCKMPTVDCSLEKSRLEL
jgi:ribosomal protein S17